tara:strand:+ start:1129 stop:1566 length:438 start_codon:yes stop_codon:yes gene_type:complete
VTTADEIDVDASLRAAGLRVTDTRRAVFSALRGAAHVAAEPLFDRVRETLPGTSKQSVYNALGDFVDAGIARRIEPAGLAGLYELRVGDNHHHLVCTECGRVEDVDCVTGAAPCLHPSDTRGFAVRAAEVTFWGVCARCAAPGEP